MIDEPFCSGIGGTQNLRPYGIQVQNELPGVKSVGAVSTVLLGSLPASSPMTPEGRPDLPQAVNQ